MLYKFFQAQYEDPSKEDWTENRFKGTQHRGRSAKFQNHVLKQILK